MSAPWPARSPSPARLLIAVRLALAGNPDYGAYGAPGARALEELTLWSADVDTSARQPMHVHLRRPDFVIECDASASALAAILLRAPDGVTVGGRFLRRLDAREAAWSSCLREMSGYEFGFATLAATHDLRDRAVEIVGDHRAIASTPSSAAPAPRGQRTPAGVGRRSQLALPSFHVIDEILDVVVRDNAAVILSVPAWTSRPWCTRLWSAAWAARRTACPAAPRQRTGSAPAAP